MKKEEEEVRYRASSINEALTGIAAEGTDEDRRWALLAIVLSELMIALKIDMNHDFTKDGRM